MSKYVNFDHILAFLAEARRGTRINNSPYMDNAKPTADLTTRYL